NCIGLETTMREFENYIPMNTLNRFYEPQVLSGIEEWRTCDIPESIAKSVHNLAEYRTCDWDEVADKKKKDKVSRVKNRFNTEYILATTEEDFQGHEFLLDEIIMWHKQIVSLLEA
ncbi:hypothetical protein VB880_000680, partial [Enterococcus faecalis]|nr:hypothetical protein [Enterococcus faecalis]